MTFKQVLKLNFDTLQTTICNKSFSHSKPLGQMIREILRLFDIPPFDIKVVIWWPICFQNGTKFTLRQAFLDVYILCKSDSTGCNILNFRIIMVFEQLSKVPMFLI